MKNIRIAILSILLLSLLSLYSCVYSLFPIYTEDTLVFLPDLVGTWEEGGIEIAFEAYFNEQIDSSNFELENEVKEWLKKRKENGYKMTVNDSDGSIEYQVRIAQIGKNLFMDMYPNPSGSKFEGRVIENFIPVHTFSKIEVLDQTLVITDFDLEKLRDLFKSNLIRLRHENVEGDIIITAQPEEIQKFLKIYAEDEGVFESPDEYRKVESQR